MQGAILKENLMEKKATCYFLIIILTSVLVKEDEASNIIFDPEIISAGTSVIVRCESKRYTRCEFYRDTESNPFKVVWNQSACQFTLLWSEFQKWNRPDGLNMSCVSLHDLHQESDKSKPKILLVEDPIGNPEMYMGQLEQHYVLLRCRAKRGTNCHFYLNNHDAPFITCSFTGGVCVGKVSEKVLLGTKTGDTIHCEVVLNVESVEFRQKSEPFIIPLDATANDSDGSSPFEIPMQPSSSPAKSAEDGIQKEESSNLFLYIGLASGAILLSLMTCSVLYLRHLKHGNSDTAPNSGNPFHQQNEDDALYSNITIPDLRIHPAESSALYAMVRRIQVEGGTSAALEEDDTGTFSRSNVLML